MLYTYKCHSPSLLSCQDCDCVVRLLQYKFLSLFLVCLHFALIIRTFEAKTRVELALFHFVQTSPFRSLQ